MKQHILVCPFDEELFTKFQNKRLIVRTNNPEQILEIRDKVQKSNNNLHHILLENQGAISSIPFRESWRDVNIVIHAAKLGSFKEFLFRIKLVRSLVVRFYLPVAEPSTYTNIQILSSLGVETGLIFNDKVDWEKTMDLTHYFLYARGQHSNIEPFNYIIHHHHSDKFTNFDYVYFNDPENFLHINSQGKIAATQGDLQTENYLDTSIEQIDEVGKEEKYKNTLTRWQDFFLKTEGCAYCPAWRICMGKFEEQAKTDTGCQTLFGDILEAAEKFVEENENKHNQNHDNQPRNS